MQVDVFIDGFFPMIFFIMFVNYCFHASGATVVDAVFIKDVVERLF